MANSIADNVLEERCTKLLAIKSICKSMLNSIEQADFYARASHNKAKKLDRTAFKLTEGMYTDTCETLKEYSEKLTSIVDTL